MQKQGNTEGQTKVFGLLFNGGTAQVFSLRHTESGRNNEGIKDGQNMYLLILANLLADL